MSRLARFRLARIPFPVRRGISYGAALGLLAGLAYLGAVEFSPEREVVVWRNFVLGGVAVGLVCGVIVSYLGRRRNRSAGD